MLGKSCQTVLHSTPIYEKRWTGLNSIRLVDHANRVFALSQVVMYQPLMGTGIPTKPLIGKIVGKN